MTGYAPGVSKKASKVYVFQNDWRRRLDVSNSVLQKGIFHFYIAL